MEELTMQTMTTTTAYSFVAVDAMGDIVDTLLPLLCLSVIDIDDL